jgi:hypothetical protein
MARASVAAANRARYARLRAAALCVICEDPSQGQSLQLDLFGTARVSPPAPPTWPARSELEPDGAGMVGCRVRACPARRGRVPCPEHDTPAIRAMARPHLYFFLGRRVVLEGAPWDVAGLAVAVDEKDEASVGLVHVDIEHAVLGAQVPATDHVQVDEKDAAASSLIHSAPLRPCWAFCGRPGPARGCHPGSRFSQAPTVPCLACGHEFLPCRAPSGSAVTCCGPCRDLVSVLRTDDDELVQAFAKAHLSSEAHEHWEERAAIMHTGRPRGAAGRALAAVWRGVGEAT